MIPFPHTADIDIDQSEGREQSYGVSQKGTYGTGETYPGSTTCPSLVF